MEGCLKYFATGEGSDLLSYIERPTGSTRADKLTLAETDTSTTGAFDAANVLKGLRGKDTLDTTDGTGNHRVDGGTGAGVCGRHQTQLPVETS